MSHDLPDRARQLARNCIHQDGSLATTLREIAAKVDELQALNLIQTARIKLLIDLFDGGDLVGMADAIEGTQDAPGLREVCHV